MKAMVLAAGLGTRLRPLTNDRPKALVEIAGRTLLDITLARLRNFGINDVIVNVHHFADLVIDYLQKHRNFGMHIEVSRENVLLDTGGGLKKAAYFFLEHMEKDGGPFVLHNVDVISTIDLQKMLKFHVAQQALATLAVKDRRTSRYLLFNEGLELCGRRSADNQNVELVRPCETPQAFAFCGVHVISSRFLKTMIEEGIFSIITSYLRLAAQGEKLVAFHADDYYWLDVGKPESLTQACHDFPRLFSAND